VTTKTKSHEERVVGGNKNGTNQEVSQGRDQP